MKPAPFDYHAPDHAPRRRSALLAELGDEAKVLAGGQSLVPMLALRLAVVRPPRRPRPHRRAPRASSARRRRVRIGAGTTQATIERSRRGRRRGPAARPGHAADRPLPDPQPGHDRRVARPRRPGGRVPRGGARARRRAGGPGAGRAADGARRRLLHRACGRTALGRRRAADRRHVPGVAGPLRVRGRGVRPPPRRLRHRRRRRRRRARRRRPGQPLRHRPARPRLDAAAGRGGRGARPPARRRRRRRRRARAAGGRRRSTPCPSDLHGSAAYRRRVGAAHGRRAWRRAPSRRPAVAEVDDRGPGQRRRRRGRGRAPADAGRLPAGALPPHRHPPRLRARRLRRLHGPARRRGRALAAWCFAVQADGARGHDRSRASPRPTAGCPPSRPRSATTTASSAGSAPRASS